MSTVGPILSFAEVERWVLALSRKWFKDYLEETERQLGEPEGTFANLESFIVANEWGSWPEERLPCLLVQDTGLGGTPTRYGGGLWRARRLYGASVIVQAPNREDVRWSAGLYAAAFRTMLLQNQSLDHPEHVVGLDWADERPAQIPTDDERNIGAQIMLFYVDVKDVADEGGMPSIDPDDPPGTGPEDPPVVIDPTPDDPEIPPGGSSITIRTREV